MSASEYLRQRAAAFRAQAERAVSPAKRDRLLSVVEFCDDLAIQIEAESAHSEAAAAA